MVAEQLAWNAYTNMGHLEENPDLLNEDGFLKQTPDREYQSLDPRIF